MVRSSNWLALGAAFGSLLGASPLETIRHPPPASPFCSISVSPLGRPPGTTYFLGTFTDRTAEVGLGPIRPTGLPGHVSSGTNAEGILGQYVRVSASGGWDAEAVHDPTRGPEGEVLLVFWDYDPGCLVTYYSGAHPAGIPGEEALVLGRLRDRDQWVGGVPTLDTFYGGGLVHPMASLTEWREFQEWAQSEYPSPPWERSDDLSAAEAFELMRMMPDPCEELWDPLSFTAKSAAVTLTYLHDDRYTASRALQVLENRALRVDGRRALCLADPRVVSLPEQYAP